MVTDKFRREQEASYRRKLRRAAAEAWAAFYGAAARYEAARAEGREALADDVGEALAKAEAASEREASFR